MAPDGLTVESAVERALPDAAGRLEAAGWTMEEASCPSLRDAQRLQTTLWLVELRHAGARMTDEENDPDAAFVYRQLAAQTPECDVNGLLDAFQRRAGLIRAWHQFLEAYPPLTPGRGKSRVKELEASVNAWSRSRRIREYLAAVAVGAEPDDEALQAWLPTGSYIC